MLNKRQEQILAVLSEKNQWITGKSLSAMMKVSDRTIRSDIETINREIEASPIVQCAFGIQDCRGVSGENGGAGASDRNRDSPDSRRKVCLYYSEASV